MPREFGVYPATTVSLRPADFSKSAKNFAKKCQKIASGAYYPRQNVAPWGCNKKKILETNSICMDFICLQWLAVGILSGRNNGLLSCYVEFTVRAKTGLKSYLST